MASTGDYVSVHIRLAGARQFQAEAAASSRAVREIGNAGAAAGSQVGAAAGKLDVFGFNTVRLASRVARIGSWALPLLGAGIVKMGISFDATMEQQTVAFTHFLGSVGEANRELDFLYKTARETPFNFTNITGAARRFMAFGFTVDQTNRYITTMGDAVAAIGGNSEMIDRATLAIGQMRTKGKIMAQDLNQLAEIGLPVYQILQEKLHLTGDEMKRIGENGIEANKGIEAIMSGLDDRFKGAAAEQSKTFLGMWNNIVDSTRQALGYLFMRPFDFMKTGVFPDLLAAAQATADILHNGGNFDDVANALDDVFNSGSTVFTMMHNIQDSGTALYHVFKDSIGPSLVDLKYLWIALLSPLAAANDLLKLAGDHTTTFRVVLDILLPLYVGWKLALIATNGLLEIQAARIAWVAGETKAQVAWTTISTAATWLASAATDAWVVGMVALNMAMWANPIGFMVLGVVALTATLVVLYYKWQWFHDAVNTTYNFLVDNWPILAGVLMGPFGLVAAEAIQHFHDIEQAFQWTVDHIKSIWSSLHLSIDIPGTGGKAHFSVLGVIANMVPGANAIPGLADGGNVMGGGWTMVGERGPERAFLPGGSSVRPLNTGPKVSREQVRAIDFGGMGGAIRVDLHAPIMIDGKKVGDAVGSYFGDEVARR